MLQRAEARQEGLANVRFIASDAIQKDHRSDGGREKKQDQAAKTSGENQQRTELAQLRIHPYFQPSADRRRIKILVLDRIVFLRGIHRKQTGTYAKSFHYTKYAGRRGALYFRDRMRKETNRCRTTGPDAGSRIHAHTA